MSSSEEEDDVIEPTADLNKLFNMQYGFDMLKGVIG
jgi:hypothetical protein